MINGGIGNEESIGNDEKGTNVGKNGENGENDQNDKN